MISFTHILEQSVLFLPLSLGIFMSYRVLRCTDLTVDGSFVLGAAVFARCAVAGGGAPLGQLAAVAAGALAGCAVSLVQRRVQPLLAGILVLFILHSFNLQVMGRPNISLLGIEGLLNTGPVLAGTALVICVGLYVLLSSRGGLALRAFGNNPRLLRQQGRSPELLRMAGLALSNSLVALSGAMTAQVNGYADVQMGFGMVMIGIGTVVLGQQLMQRLSVRPNFCPHVELAACGLGVLVYFSALHGCLAFGVDPLYLKMLLGLALIACMMSGGADYAQERS